MAATGVTGVCGSGIIDAVAEMYLAGVIDRDGAIVGANAARSARVVPDGRTFRYVLYGEGDDELSITQNDVRAVQLAKAALRAGIDLLLEHAGDPPVADVRLAGAFGAHIDPLHAMVLGLVPDCPLDGVRSVGNAAGAGAVQALLSRALRARDGADRGDDREDRDRDRTALPGAVRRGDGVPARQRPAPAPRVAGHPARRTASGGGRAPATATTFDRKDPVMSDESETTAPARGATRRRTRRSPTRPRRPRAGSRALHHAGDAARTRSCRRRAWR